MRQSDWIGVRKSSTEIEWTYVDGVETIEQAKNTKGFEDKEIVGVKKTHDFVNADGGRTNLWADGTSTSSSIKDIYSLSIGGAGNFLAGGAQGGLNFNWLTRGEDASFWPYITLSGGGQVNAFSIDANFTGSVGSSMYGGSATNLNSSVFGGMSMGVQGSVGVDALGKVMVGSSKEWSMPGLGSGGLTTTKLSLNLGVGAGTVVQGGGTLSKESGAIRMDELFKLALRSLKVPDYIRF